MSSGSTPPDEPVFFLDHCLGCVAVKAALTERGAQVEVHLDWFPDGHPDTDLLRAVGARGWLFLSKDGNIRRRPLELHALKIAGVKAFILTSGNLRGQEQAEAFRRAYPRMLRICRQDGPFIARVTRSGDVEIVEC